MSATRLLMAVGFTLVYGPDVSAQGLLDDRWACQADDTVYGEDMNDHQGSVMATGGDWNDDGTQDLIVMGGIGTVAPAPGFIDSTVRVYASIGGEFAHWLTITGVETGYRTNSGVVESRTGSVSFIGDISGGGIDDIAIGAPFWSTELSAPDERGKVYIILAELHQPLQPSDLPIIMDVHDAEIIIKGEDHSRFDWSIDGTGDLDDDGLTDLLIGAPGSIDDTTWSPTSTQKGEVFGYYGSTFSAIGYPLGGGGPIIWGAYATADFSFEGESRQDRFGYLVRFLGDLDAIPGRDDEFIVGAIEARETTRGFGFEAVGDGYAKLYSRVGGVVQEIHEFSAVPPSGFNLDLFGFSATAIPSIDADAVPDIIIGAPKYGDGTLLFMGAIYAYSGSSPFAALSTGGLQPLGLDGNSHFGWSVASPGAFNPADEIPDIAVAAPGHYLDPPSSLPCGANFLYGGHAAGQVFVVSGLLPAAGSPLAEFAHYKGTDVSAQDGGGKQRLGWSLLSWDANDDGSKDIVAAAVGASASSSLKETGQVALFLVATSP